LGSDAGVRAKPYRIIHKLYVVDYDKILVREIREYDKG